MCATVYLYPQVPLGHPATRASSNFPYLTPTPHPYPHNTTTPQPYPSPPHSQSMSITPPHPHHTPTPPTHPPHPDPALPTPYSHPALPSPKICPHLQSSGEPTDVLLFLNVGPLRVRRSWKQSTQATERVLYLPLEEAREAAWPDNKWRMERDSKGKDDVMHWGCWVALGHY